MKLSAPKQNTFIISVIVAVVGLLMALGVLAMIPIAAVWVMAVAYVILAAGCLMKGM
ncbi:MAG: hypothetical protein M3O03_08885 [Pseudomonadota bacterium]|nr:hypothetical protein [Pseudomonadota bacterium]